jgi:PAS domain S-box-containing protein
MEKAAAFEAELFQELADRAPVILWRVDATFEHDWANQSWFDFTGGTLEEQNGFAWVDKVHPEDRDRVVEELGGAFEARRAVDVEFRLRDKDGRYGWIRASGSPVYRNGEFAGFVGSCVEITERRDAELRAQALQDELERLSRAEAINAEVSGGLYELAQPLQAIAVSSAILDGLIGGREDLPPDLVEGVLVIREAAERATAMLRRGGKSVLDLKNERMRADLGHTLLSAEPLLRAHGQADRVTVEWKLTEGLEADINVIEIQRVLLNLAENAFEAMSEAPDRRLKIEASSWGALAIVSVTDSGPGVPLALRAGLFETLVSTKREGIGIGLYVSRSIVEAHGGRIWLESPAGGGAVFKFTLPLAI